jgi:uncharacterized membrane protein (DUF373 family)
VAPTRDTGHIAVAAPLVLSLALALLGAAALLVEGAHGFAATEPLDRIIDRLLFVLMLVDILHTVHASVRTGTLLCEPFLVIGLIACIRGVLVITIETSQITQPEKRMSKAPSEDAGEDAERF